MVVPGVTPADFPEAFQTAPTGSSLQRLVFWSVFLSLGPPPSKQSLRRGWVRQLVWGLTPGAREQSTDGGECHLIGCWHAGGQGSAAGTFSGDLGNPSLGDRGKHLPTGSRPQGSGLPHKVGRVCGSRCSFRRGARSARLAPWVPRSAPWVRLLEWWVEKGWDLGGWTCGAPQGASSTSISACLSLQVLFPFQSPQGLRCITLCQWSAVNKLSWASVVLGLSECPPVLSWAL